MSEHERKAEEQEKFQSVDVTMGEGRADRIATDKKRLSRGLCSEEQFPFAIALLTGVVAALIIMAAGVQTERQSYVILERAVVGFLGSGLAMFFACRWLHDRGIPLYVNSHEEMQHSWVSAPEVEHEEGEPLPLEISDAQEDASVLTDNAFMPEESEFSPLGDSLPHIELPKQ